MTNRIYAICLVAGAFLTASAQAKPACDKCNVVVIAMDAVQAAHVHSFGNKLENTPVLDGLAEHGTAFTQAISPAPWTVPAYLSLFSSMYPSAHGLTNRYLTYSSKEKVEADFKKHTPEIITLAQVFKDNGYKTGGFTGDAGVSAILGYDKGFETFTDETHFGGLENSSDKALAWLDKVGHGNFLLFVHGYDAHGQFKLPEGYHSKFWTGGPTRFKGTPQEQAEMREAGLRGEFPKLTDNEKAFWRAWYDGKIADADARVGHFLDELKKRGLLEHTIVVVLSDHGTEFFEHGRVDHGHTLYDELIHVPFIVDLPGQKKGHVVTAQVTTLDLLPTLMDLTGVKSTPALKKQISGVSLAKAVRTGKFAGEDVYSETDYRNYTHKRSLRTKDGWKYIMTLENGGEELYNVHSDPGEKHNLISEDKTMAAKLKEKLTKHLDAMPVAPTRLASGCLPAYPGQCDGK